MRPVMLATARAAQWRYGSPGGWNGGANGGFMSNALLPAVNICGFYVGMTRKNHSFGVD